MVADYLKAKGKNESTRLVEISDLDAVDLDEAFWNMSVVCKGSKVRTPLHHISINAFQDERLTDEQTLKIVELCEKKYGYKPHDHQRVIVEHIKKGRQHFHIVWNRVSLTTGRPVQISFPWYRSKDLAREIEEKFGLRSFVPRRFQRARVFIAGGASRIFGCYDKLDKIGTPILVKEPHHTIIKTLPSRPVFYPAMRILAEKSHKEDEKMSNVDKQREPTPEENAQALLAWAWENKRVDILYTFGIVLPPDYTF